MRASMFASFLVLAYAPAAFAGVVINEINADPDAVAGDANCDNVLSTTNDEFIELVNTGASSVDVSSWTISDSVQVRHTIPAGTILAPMEALLVFGGGTPTFDGTSANPAAHCMDLTGLAQWQTASTGLTGFNNTGDTITLSNAAGVAQDSYTYGAEGGNNDSLVRATELDVSTAMVEHLTVSTAMFSPGTYADGSPFMNVNPPLTLAAAVPGKPGANTWALSNGAPGTKMYLVWGTQQGSFAVPGCPNLSVSIKAPAVATTANTNQNGAATFSSNIPAAAAGHTGYFQAVDTVNCEVSNVAPTTF